MFAFNTIAFVRSCFKEKFGIPCQPGLVTEAKAVIEFVAPYDRPEAVAGLEQSSHIWVQFIFHGVNAGWKPTVRPPRLGGNRRMGVFATRAPVRPNPLGLSVVKLERVDIENGVRLHVSGIDILDGSPVVDIKPYVPYVDRLEGAENKFAEAPRRKLKVSFEQKLLHTLAEIKQTELKQGSRVDFSLLVEQVLSQDPRPQYQQLDTEREYGMRLLNFDVKWRYREEQGETIILVFGIENVEDIEAK